MKGNAAALLAICLGAALTAAGVFLSQGGMVFTKAARICLECVGIG